VIGEPLAHTLARIGAGLFGGMCLLFPLVVWLADLRGATDRLPQLKKGHGPWRVALFLGFGAICIAFALIPTRVPTRANTLAREQTVALFFPVYAFFFIAYVVWVAIELRKTLAWRQHQRQSVYGVRESGIALSHHTTASARRGPLPRLSRRMRRLSRSH
jgi:hypothetical protein